jgi:hypothetical protein
MTRHHTAFQVQLSVILSHEDSHLRIGVALIVWLICSPIVSQFKNSARLLQPARASWPLRMHEQDVTILAVSSVVPRKS